MQKLTVWVTREELRKAMWKQEWKSVDEFLQSLFVSREIRGFM